MKWTEIKIRTNPKHEEIVSSILYDIGVKGLEIEDPRDVLEKIEDPSWDFLEPEELLEKYDLETIIIKAYISENENLEEMIYEIKNNIEILPKEENGESFGQIEFDEVFEKDWENNWKKFYKTARIGKNIVIKPSWEKYEKRHNDIVIELDPGMAFGTGTHETTSLCLEQIEKNSENRETFLDIGCGSGILSILAAKIGFKEVVGVDIDELAIKVSNENAKINEVLDIVDFRKGDLLDVINKKYDMVVANILAEVIILLNKDIKRCLKDNGIFISSGIILDKLDLVKMSLNQAGLEILEIITKGEWACIISKIKEQ